MTKHKIEILEEDDGEIAGINRATIRVEGEYAYGLLRTETGVREDLHHVQSLKKEGSE